MINFLWYYWQEQLSFGVLAELNKNDLLLFSPDQAYFKANKVLGASVRTPRSQSQKSFASLLNQGVVSKSSSVEQCAAICSPAVNKNKHQSESSSLLEMVTNNAGSDAAAENFSM